MEITKNTKQMKWKSFSRAEYNLSINNVSVLSCAIYDLNSSFLYYLFFNHIKMRRSLK